MAEIEQMPLPIVGRDLMSVRQQRRDADELRPACACGSDALVVGVSVFAASAHGAGRMEA